MIIKREQVTTLTIQGQWPDVREQIVEAIDSWRFVEAGRQYQITVQTAPPPSPGGILAVVQELRQDVPGEGE